MAHGGIIGEILLLMSGIYYHQEARICKLVAWVIGLGDRHG